MGSLTRRKRHIHALVCNKDNQNYKVHSTFILPLSCPHTCISDRSVSTDLICTDQIGQISASVWGATNQIWYIRSLILIFHHVEIPYPPANIIAKCVAGSGRDVTDTGDDRFMDTDFITCTIY